MVRDSLCALLPPCRLPLGTEKTLPKRLAKKIFGCLQPQHPNVFVLGSVVYNDAKIAFAARQLDFGPEDPAPISKTVAPSPQDLALLTDDVHLVLGGLHPRGCPTAQTKGVPSPINHCHRRERCYKEDQPRVRVKTLSDIFVLMLIQDSHALHPRAAVQRHCRHRNLERTFSRLRHH